VAAQLGKHLLGKWLLGRARRELVEGIIPRLPPGVAVGVIAGNVGLGLGRLIASISGPHDGTVAVDETRIASASDSLLVATTHTGMIFSARVVRQVARFLTNGRFVRDRDV